MNNKGQTLVTFIIILPILLIILALVVDLGFIYIEKRNIDNNLYDATNYYLENIDEEDIEEKIKKLLNKNIDDINKITIVDKEDYIEITVSKDIKNIYSIIKDTKIEITYKGIKGSKEIIKG